jgi:hypothetical protein
MLYRYPIVICYPIRYQIVIPAGFWRESRPA